MGGQNCRRSGLSGSISWHNSVRARLFLRTATTEDGDEPDAGLRELQFLKNQFGPCAERILLRYKDGVFQPEPGLGSIEKAAADVKIDSLFLELLQRFNKQGRNVNDKPGPSFAPKLFAQEPEAKSARIKSTALADAMRRLFVANRIHLEPYGKPSRQFWRLAPVAPS